MLPAAGAVGPHGEDDVRPDRADVADIVGQDFRRPHFSNVSSVLNE
jgi:hypothetical protein